MVVWSIGHSTHPLDDFLALLEGHAIRQLADVRKVPRSRRHPHFRSDALAESLPSAEIVYRHMPNLGGFRRPREDSPNRGWENVSFRGYADYAQTDEFAAAFGQLARWADEARTAVMCSESLWWRCHRRLISDQFVVRGWEVRHIGSDGRVNPHELTPFAQSRDGLLHYPAEQAELW